jgi:hypothetical protein
MSGPAGRAARLAGSAGVTARMRLGRPAIRFSCCAIRAGSGDTGTERRIRVRQTAIQYWSQGGLVTISAHLYKSLWSGGEPPEFRTKELDEKV